MEPADLNSLPPNDARLEVWYRAKISAASLPDDGFSRRVLSALPAPAKQADTKRRLFCLIGALAGAGVAWLGASNSPDVLTNLSVIDAALTDVFLKLATPAVGGALGLTAICLWCVFGRALRPLLRF